MTETSTALITPPAPVDLNNPLDTPKALEAVLMARAASDIEPFLRGTDVTVDRFIRTVIHVVAQKPDLLRLNGASIVMAVLEAARMGLEPTGKFGGAYIVPRKGQAVLEVAYNGFIKMAMREGAIARAHAANVYTGDHFEWAEGTNPHITHKPTRGAAFEDEARGNITHTYAVAWYPDGNYDFVVMETAEVDAIRQRSEAFKHGSGPWITDDGEMRRKTSVRRLFKYIPAVYNPALQYALEREDRVEVEPIAEAAPVSSRRASVVAALTGNAPEEEQLAGEPDSEEGLPE